MADLEALLRMGVDFHEAAGFKKYVDLDLESLADTFIDVMDSDQGFVLVAEHKGEVVGFSSALIYPFWMNRSHLVGQQLAIWVDEEKRATGIGVKLIRGMEDAAREKGAEFFLSVVFNALNSNDMRKLFKGLGYKALEQAFIRRL